MKYYALAGMLAAAQFVFGASSKPVYSWDFETDDGKAKLRGGERRAGQGFDATKGAWVGKGALP